MSVEIVSFMKNLGNFILYPYEEDDAYIVQFDETTRKFDLVLQKDLENSVAWMNSKALAGFTRKR